MIRDDPLSYEDLVTLHKPFTQFLKSSKENKEE